LKSICVFCGSSPGKRPEYGIAAETLGRLLAERGLELIYGGGSVGLMGILSNACLAAGGRVIGLIPKALIGREVAGRMVEHTSLTRLEVVDSMHTRKARMAELADGFIALPGGFGTFEELFEILTWAQLGFHRKPIGILDVESYYEPLLSLCDRALAEGFLKPESRRLLLAHTDLEALLESLAAYKSEPVAPWIQDEKQL
jgi:uncharacterized protein (TIGR00730 family)